MEFTTEMFIDLAYKSGILVAYTLALVVVWWLVESLLGSFRRGA